MAAMPISPAPGSLARRTPRCPMTADLAARPESVGLARELVNNWLGPHPCADAAVLLTSETVTNAVRHGSPPDRSGVVRLVARWTGRRVYVAVTDDGAGTTTPHLVKTGLDAENGRGLAMVDMAAQRWGSVRTQHGRRRVWFELVAG